MQILGIEMSGSFLTFQLDYPIKFYELHSQCIFILYINVVNIYTYTYIWCWGIWDLDEYMLFQSLLINYVASNRLTKTIMENTAGTCVPVAVDNKWIFTRRIADKSEKNNII